jgi:hypothetical protein
LNYNNDMNYAFDAIEKATWLSKDEYVDYMRKFHEYEQERSECLSHLVEMVGSSEKDISSGWTSTRGLGAVALAQIKDNVPCLRDGDPNLGLRDWTDRETQMFESLKAEDFLRARQNLITLKEQTTEAAGMLDQTWKDFDQRNLAVNSEIVQKENAFKDQLTSWARVAGDAADLLSQAIGGAHGLLGQALTTIKILGKNSRELRPFLEDVHLKMQAKRPNWEALSKLNAFQEEILKRIDPGIIDRMVSDGRLPEVSGSDDFRSFAADASDKLTKVHQQAALSACEDFRRVAMGKFASRSSDTIENIVMLDSLGKNWREFEQLQQGVENGPLKVLEEAINKMRDGPEKDAAASALKDTREGLADLVNDGKKDLEEYTSEAEKVK